MCFAFVTRSKREFVTFLPKTLVVVVVVVLFVFLTKEVRCPLLDAGWLHDQSSVFFSAVHVCFHNIQALIP